MSVIIPQPVSVIPASGEFIINAQTQISTADTLAPAAELLASLLGSATGYTLPIVESQPTAGNIIVFSLSPDTAAEAYTLSVSPQDITIQASTPAGAMYAVQTLRQLLPASGNSVWAIPAQTITDAPRFGWRGLHLDVGRQYFPVAFIKKFIDLMVLYKFNIFHWHLTEDQGWRIEIKKYPLLTEVGSRRAESPYPHNRHETDGVPYGGFYTQDEVREVVAYASAHGVTVVPEIEMPGHAQAALAAYPHLGCRGQGYEVATTWGIKDEVFCAGNDAVFTLLEDVLTEVMTLFPSEFIHIGGDECPKARWEACPKCQQRIQEEGLADEHALQSYFIRRIETFLNANGRRLIGWDEILEGGLAPNATVMSWRGSEGGIQAASAGHDVVMTPNTHCYLDYYQSQDKDNEPPAIGGFLPLEKVYAFDPTHGIPADKTHHVLGGQGNVWTEYLPTEALVEYMTWPRAAALAEKLWSTPENTAYGDFLTRLQVHEARLKALNVNYRPLDN